MQPGDRLMCAIINERDLDTVFRAWPLHLTIVPWFRLDVESEELGQELENMLGDVNALTLWVGDEAHFGHHARKLVNLIQFSESLQHIERSVRQFLHEKKAWLVDETTKARVSYRPHVTAQGTARLQKGESFECHNLYVVEQKGSHKEIVSEVKLQNVATAAP